jgi:hypothetical protein
MMPQPPPQKPTQGPTTNQPNPGDLPGRIVAVQQGTARLGTASLPGTVALVGPASPDVCEPLAEIPDSGPLLLEVELASSAAPLRVRSNRDRQSPYVRCLMERACRVRVPSEAASQRVTLPLVLRVEDPPPPPPPTTSRPTSRIEVHPVKDKNSDPLHLLAATIVKNAGKRCLMSQPLISGTLRIRLDVRDQSAAISRGSFLGDIAPPSRRFRITQVATEGSMTPEMSGLMACMASGLNARAFRSMTPGSGPLKPASVRVDVVVSLP